MSTKKRIFEIDFIRATAIILMIVFHLVVDLKDFYGYNVEYLTGFWYYEGKLSAILFIFISGISSTFSKNNLKRGLVIIGWAIALTIITYLYNSQLYIRFGILHFLGLSMILYHFLNKHLKIKHTIFFLIISTLLIVIGYVFSTITIRSPYLFIIGLSSNSFSSMDYYPMLPWFGLYLYGVLTGKKIYAERKSLFPSAYHLPIISHISRYSLFIYLIHQPILLAILYIIH